MLWHDSFKVRTATRVTRKRDRGEKGALGMKLSSKKLIVWLLGAAIGLCIHANYVSGKKGPAQIPHVKPADVLSMHALLSDEELEGLRALYEQLSPAMGAEI